MSPPEFFDKSGRDLKAGDLIVYGHALGRCAGLQYGLVLEVLEPRTERSWAETPDLIPRIRVQGVDRSDNYQGQQLGWMKNQTVPDHPPKLLKASVLTFSSRILKLSRDQVPPDVLALTDAVDLTVLPGPKKPKKPKP